MRALRPELEDERTFVQRVDEEQRPERYRLVGVFIPGSEQAVAVAGFRPGHSLSWDHYLYVDDLSTVPGARRRGYAAALLEWLVEEGRRLGCQQLHLDSAVGPNRFDAHRLYHAHGFAIHGHHFERGL